MVDYGHIGNHLEQVGEQPDNLRQLLRIVPVDVIAVEMIVSLDVKVVIRDIDEMLRVVRVQDGVDFAVENKAGLAEHGEDFDVVLRILVQRSPGPELLFGADDRIGQRSGQRF